MREERDTKILEAAIAEAYNGWQWITRAAIADRAKVSLGSVNNAFGTMVDLKRAVMRAAVERRLVPIVAMGLAEGSPIAGAAPADLKEEAAAFITA